LQQPRPGLLLLGRLPAKAGPAPQPLVHAAAVQLAVFSPDEQHLATLDAQNQLRIWQLDMQRPQVFGQPLQAHGHGGNTTAMAFSPDGRMLATAGRDGQVQLLLWRHVDLLQEAQRRVGRALSQAELAQHLPAWPKAGQ
jgi:WD40 repeat protein